MPMSSALKLLRKRPMRRRMTRWLFVWMWAADLHQNVYPTHLLEECREKERP